MKNKLFIFAVLAGAVLALGSCSDFLDETADKSGNAYIYHMDQLYGLTGQPTLYVGRSDVSSAWLETSYFMQEQYMMGDGVLMSPNFYTQGMPMYFMMLSYFYPLYSWDSYTLKNESGIFDMTWKAAYERIYTFNTVLENMDKVIQTTPAIRAQVEGEARFGRAFFHFMLLTQYCQWQDDAPGIGYREDTNPSGVPDRQTVGYTLERIYEDLDLAEQKLTEAGRTAFDFDYSTRPTVPTVQALRARVALYRGDYETALENAENALKGNGELENVAADPYNALEAQAEFVFLNQDGTRDLSTMMSLKYPSVRMPLFNQATLQCRELYLPCLSSHLGSWGMPISESFYNLFTDKVNDARWTYFYDNCSSLMNVGGFYTTAEDGVNEISWEARQWLKPWELCSHWHFYSQLGATDVVGMTTAEMYLTKAECLARTGHEGEAAEVLKTLRRTRFTDQAAADDIGGSLQEVLDERSREMGPFWRFYEAKRLNGLDNAGIELRRQILSVPSDPASSVTEIVIPANDPRWALPFYEMERESMGWQQNEGWE